MFLTKREKRILNELQLLTGVMTDDISYLCFLLLKDGTYFNKTKTDKEKEEDKILNELESKQKSVQAMTFDDFLKLM